MKPIYFLFSIILLISCSGNNYPDPGTRKVLEERINIIKVKESMETLISEGSSIRVYGNAKGPESFAFLQYILPVLQNEESLSLHLWFLEGNNPEVIQAYLNDDAGAPSEEELLLTSSPLLGGYQEYKEFLQILKAMYQTLEDPAIMEINGPGEAFFEYALFGENDLIRDDKKNYLLHSPLPRSRRRWSLPYDGLLYFMMIHHWPMQQYGSLTLEGSPLAELPLYEGAAPSSELLDGIILLGIADPAEALRPLENFIHEDNVDRALPSFPNQIIREKKKPAAYLINEKIGRDHKIKSRRLKQIYQRIIAMEKAFQE